VVAASQTHVIKGAWRGNSFAGMIDQMGGGLWPSLLSDMIDEMGGPILASFARVGTAMPAATYLFLHRAVSNRGGTGSIVPALAENARTGHPEFRRGREREWKDGPPAKSRRTRGNLH
jgi:hypothetical protein